MSDLEHLLRKQLFFGLFLALPKIQDILAVATGSWDLGQISSTMESTQSSARRPSRLTYKEASGMAATLSMLEDIGALHAALKISAENDKDQLL